MSESKKKLIITKKKVSSNTKLTKPTKTSKDTIKQSHNETISKSHSKSRSKSLDKYTPPQNTDIIHPKIWELPNRKTYYNWVLDTFGQYEIANPKKHKVYKKRFSEHFILSDVQRLLRDYLQGESPVRGILLYLGLGVGKTCTGVTISEAILNRKKVLILSKANLKTNWIKDIRNCGSDYCKNYNHWVFKSCDTDEMRDFVKDMGIPLDIIKKNNGVFLVDFTKNESNYTELDSIQREKLDQQLEATMNHRFEFESTDNPILWKKLKQEDFNDKIIIIDEVHNIGNKMAANDINAMNWYNSLMNAKNSKIVLLSGTPIVNRIFEITKIFNILRGYMHVLEIRFKTTFDTAIDYSNIKYNLKKSKYIDQIIVNQGKKLIKVTKTPDNFINSPDNKGLIYKPEENITHDQFKDMVNKIIQNSGYKAVVDWQPHPETCFPEDEEQFNLIFYNPELNKLKHIDLIRRRIAGLTSYYEYKDTSIYPKLLAVNNVQVPMSEYVFSNYERFRHQELEKDRFMKRKGDPEDDDAQSSYRIASRMACTFAFPEEIGNPSDTKKGEDNLLFLEKVGERFGSFGFRMSQSDEMKKDEIDKKINEGYLRVLEQDKSKYLDITNGSLARYSPKYLMMINNILKQAPKGKLVVYSQFNNLVGLATFALALEQTGKWVPFRIKKVNKMWELDEREDEKDKYKFVFYTGNEDPEIRDIYRKILNSEWDLLSTSCDKLVKKIKAIHKNNYYGEVIKMLMTNKTGSEGLDLKEIRNIHIMEPYWNDVLIEQVIGRGVRKNSHIRLPANERNVEAFIYMSTITPDLVRKISYIDVRNDTYKYPNAILPDKVNKVVTTDEYIFLLANRKKAIINEFQKLMKETAFDCTLNYKDNILEPSNKNLLCLDYPTKNRDDYLFTPAITDTIENLDIAQEKIVTTKYQKIRLKGIEYYESLTPASDGKYYIYDESMVGRVRLPKPVGEVKIVNGKKQYLIKAKKNAKAKNKK